ncbi:response regulator receiver domain-containing protein [Maribacter spongiicola]|uniref:Response regulator receiver domain-containing protein n=1 Tax=Maribacter spongiicola TaxID=1206753 RepID=A0A4R7JYW6_9FLAO|nr:response regulator [Maribacter spongiicola]TDT43720.1 response regulator receiver domain-containing protein [Maribacter spongiicola]
MIVDDVFHLFMAEDDLDDQQIFREAIASIEGNLKITMFSNGMDLLETLRTNPNTPDVIFLDLFMPKLNGEQTLEMIRSMNHLDETPIVIFSNEYNINRISELFENGANRYLHKPNSFNTLVNALKRTIVSIKNNTLGGTAIIKYVE